MRFRNKNFMETEKKRELSEDGGSCNDNDDSDENADGDNDGNNDNNNQVPH